MTLDAFESFDEWNQGGGVPVHLGGGACWAWGGGGGRHVPMTDDPQSSGWTRAWSDVRVHPDRGEYAVAALDPAAVDARRLSLAEQTALVDAYAARRTLDATWERRITS